MGKTTAAKKPFGKKGPFGTTKGAFGKEGKGGAKGKGKGGRPLAKMVRRDSFTAAFRRFRLDTPRAR